MDGDASTFTPNTKTYAAPLSTARQDWTPDAIKLAVSIAAGGELSMLGEFAEWILQDDRVAAVIDTRCDSLFGVAPTFEFEKTHRKRRQAEKALEAEEDWFQCFPETQLRALLSWAILIGVALAEIQWVEYRGRFIPKLKVWSPKHLRYDFMTREWKLRVCNENSLAFQEIVINPGDGKWVLLTRYADERPWMRGVALNLRKFVPLKQYGIDDWGSYSEIKGQGIWFMTGVTSTAQRVEVEEKIRTMGRNAVMCLPAGVTAELVESTASTSDTFPNQISTADNSVSISVLGQNLSTEASSGTGQVSTLQGKTQHGRTRGDAETLSTCIHDQILVYWAIFNFGDALLAPWPIWPIEPVADLKELAAKLQMFGQAVATLRQTNMPIDYEALADQFDVPMLQNQPPPRKS